MSVTREAVGLAHPAVLNRPDFVEAVPNLPGNPRIRLPPATPSRYDSQDDGGLSPVRTKQRLVAH